jgi:hypothetical protein
MRTNKKFLLIIILTGLMVACATTTQLRKSWSDPSLAGSPVKPFNKVLVLVALKNEMSQRVAEDQLVSLIKNGTAVQSYSYLTPADTSKKEIVEKLIKDGFDGIITMRVKAVVQTKTTNPGTSYGNWYSTSYYTGYGYGYSATYVVGSSGNNGPSTVDVNSGKDYIIETNIYSLEKRMLLWSGSTASLKPNKIESAMNGIVSTIRKELQKKGFIKN